MGICREIPWDKGKYKFEAEASFIQYNHRIYSLINITIYQHFFQPFAIARTKLIYGKDNHYKIASGLDATGDAGASGDAVGMWSNGQTFTFWAYGNPIEGATAYHVYHNSKTCCTGEEKDTQRFTLSKNKQNEDDDLENLWIHDFTFWAFEDVRVQKFLGTALYSIIHF